MDPILLNKLELADALIYGLSIDTGSQSAVLTLAVDAEYHKGTTELLGLPEAKGVVLVDLVFSRVTTASFAGMLQRPSGAAEDEPPHEYEVSSIRVKRRPFHSESFQLEVACQNSPRCEIEFRGVTARVSARKPGIVHDYETLKNAPGS